MTPTTKNTIKGFAFGMITIFITSLAFGIFCAFSVTDHFIHDYNKTLPKQVDPISIMSSIDRTGRTITVHYVLIHPQTAEVINSMSEKTAKKVIKESFCKSNTLRFFNIEHVIKSPTGKVVYDQVLTYDDCKSLTEE
jgi:hypothetical protein